MKEVGTLLIVLGLFFAFFAFRMDTSVSTGSYGTDKVINLGLLNEKQNFIIGSVAICIIGSIFLVGGTIEQKLNFLRPVTPNEGVNNTVLNSNKTDDKYLTPRQKELQAKYERSEISLEDYKKEWDKI
jgi:hypothetical protein